VLIPVLVPAAADDAGYSEGGASSAQSWRAQQVNVHHPTGLGLGTPARGDNIFAHGIDFPGYKFFMLGADIGTPPDMPLAEVVEDVQGAGQHDHNILVAVFDGL